MTITRNINGVETEIQLSLPEMELVYEAVADKKMLKEAEVRLANYIERFISDKTYEILDAMDEDPFKAIESDFEQACGFSFKEACDENSEHFILDKVISSFEKIEADRNDKHIDWNAAFYEVLEEIKKKKARKDGY